MAGLAWVMSMEDECPHPSGTGPYPTGGTPVLHSQVKSG